jgi:HSP90 family molecular chaperone
LYTDPIRVFMEYIDNALDSAELVNIFLITLGHEAEYKHDINIEINITGKTYWSGKVKITDNCAGMDRLSKVVEQIGNSDKKSQAWLNGQFGYGIYSFLAICNTLEIKTKHANNNYSEYIKITKKDFLIDDLSNLKFDIKLEQPHIQVSGTEITLSDFTKESWLDIDPKTLKSEIESHFELLLQN